MIPGGFYRHIGGCWCDADERAVNSATSALLYAYEAQQKQIEEAVDVLGSRPYLTHLEAREDALRILRRHKEQTTLEKVTEHLEGPRISFANAAKALAADVDALRERLS